MEVTWIKFCLILVVVYAGFAASSSEEEFRRWMNERVRAACKNKNRVEILNDVNECEQKYPDDVSEKIRACKDKHDLSKEVKNGCKNLFALLKYLGCLGVVFKDENVRKQVLDSTDALDCIYGAFKKYGAYNDRLVLSDV